MSNHRTSCAAAALVFVSVCAISVVGAGQSAPTSTLDLDRYRGQVVLVDFWASWCAPCRESFPWMATMLEKYGAGGLAVVAVNLDEDPRAAKAFLAGMPGGFEHVADPGGAIPEAYGITVMPSSILFDRDGRAAYKHDGFHAKRVGEYERRIVILLEGQPDPQRETILFGSADGPGIGVRPWQRGVLASEVMRLDADPLELAIDDHIYFSKEASSGGRGFGGGGCGCN